MVFPVRLTRMSQARDGSGRMIAPRGEPSGARAEGGESAVLRAADWLGLAAAPTFAIVALLTSRVGGQPDMLCSAVQGASSLNGMVPMYVLMSAVHLGPWLKLVSGRPSGSRRS